MSAPMATRSMEATCRSCAGGAATTSPAVDESLGSAREVVRAGAPAAHVGANEGSTPSGGAERQGPEMNKTQTMTAALGALVVLGVVGAGCVEAVTNAREKTDAVNAYEVAAGALNAALTDLADVEVPDVPAEQVADPAAVPALQSAKVAAQDVPAAVDTSEGAAWRNWDTDELVDGAQALAEQTAQVQRIADALEVAVRAVVDSHARWLTDQAEIAWNAARDALSAALDAASGTLAGSDGKVADNAARDALAAAIAAATAVRDQQVAATAQGYTDAAQAATQAAATLAGPTQAVADAVAAKAEADRLAAAAAQAAKAPSGGKTTPPKKGSTGNAGTSGASPTAPQGSDDPWEGLLNGSDHWCGALGTTGGPC